MSSDDGWTTIGRGRGSRSTQAKAPATNGADISVTVDQLQRDFQKKLKIWRASSCRRTLLQMLRKNRPDEGWKFEKAVCLATGSFSTLNLELNRRAVMQLACFFDLVGEMGSDDDGGVGIEMFAQEPRYGQVDTDFLAAVGVVVLPVDGHEQQGLGPAKGHFGASTLVCDFFMNLSSEAAREFFAAEHGLYIGTPFNQPYTGSDRQVGLARDRFQESYDMRRLPVFEEDPGVFEGLMIFWPRLKDED